MRYRRPISRARHLQFLLRTPLSCAVRLAAPSVCSSANINGQTHPITPGSSAYYPPTCASINTPVNATEAFAAPRRDTVLFPAIQLIRFTQMLCKLSSVIPVTYKGPINLRGRSDAGTLGFWCSNLVTQSPGDHATNQAPPPHQPVTTTPPTRHHHPTI